MRERQMRFWETGLTTASQIDLSGKSNASNRGLISRISLEVETSDWGGTNKEGLRKREGPRFVGMGQEKTPQSQLLSGRG